MKPITLLFSLVAGMSFTSLCIASDIVSTVREGRSPISEEYKTFELGGLLGYFDNPHVPTQKYVDSAHASFDAAGEIKLKRFFFEASQGSQDGLNLGYALWANQNWSFDFLAASMIGSLGDLDSKDNDGMDEAARNDELEDRETFYIGTGFRVTRYFENYVLQYRLVADSYKNNGLTSTLRFGRGWQVRNWHFSTILSAKYLSDKTSDYLFGVDSDEATSKYPAFTSRHSMNYSLVLNATKPLSEKWVMRAYIGYILYSNNIKDSPLLDDNDFEGAALTFNYVFF